MRPFIILYVLIKLTLFRVKFVPNEAASISLPYFEFRNIETIPDWGGLSDKIFM